MTCCIDDCPAPATRIVEGFPDDVGLCHDHLWTACECFDESLSDLGCPLHGDRVARARVTVVTP